MVLKFISAIAAGSISACDLWEYVMKKQNRKHQGLSDVRHIKLKDEDIKVILRAADEIIFQADKSLLIQILEGSKDTEILELKLDECPSYSYYSNNTSDEISEYVDWMIIHNYLEITYEGQTPLIVFTEKGWETYKPICADELFHKILESDDSEKKELLVLLKDVNRQVITLLLNQIGDSQNTVFIDFLKIWEKKEAKKVRVKIKGALNKLMSV